MHPGQDLGPALGDSCLGKDQEKGMYVKACGLVQSFSAAGWARPEQDLTEQRQPRELSVSQASGRERPEAAVLCPHCQRRGRPRPAVPHPGGPGPPPGLRSPLMPRHPAHRALTVSGNWAVNKRGSLHCNYGNWWSKKLPSVPRVYDGGATAHGVVGPPLTHGPWRGLLPGRGVPRAPQAGAPPVQQRAACRAGVCAGGGLWCWRDWVSPLPTGSQVGLRRSLSLPYHWAPSSVK